MVAGAGFESNLSVMSPRKPGEFAEIVLSPGYHSL
jgi:hypothetical protein